MKRALVTGAAGFVGRHMTVALDAAGWDVTGFDLATGTDARDFFRQDDRRWDLVIHCAAVVGGRAQIEGAPLSLAVDLAIDAGLFEWALRTRPDRIVYFSSSAAYPVWLQLPEYSRRLWEDAINLASVFTPDLTYGWAKLTGEMLAEHARAEGLAVTVVRPFSGWGADQATAYPMPAFLARALRRDDPFEIWGDGTQVRDWIHIDDIVAAVLQMVAEGRDGPVNLGTGIGTSFNELARLVCHAAGYRPELKHLLSAPKGVHYRVADPTRLHEFYEPKISIEEGIQRALEGR